MRHYSLETRNQNGGFFVETCTTRNLVMGGTIRPKTATVKHQNVEAKRIKYNINYLFNPTIAQKFTDSFETKLEKFYINNYNSTKIISVTF